MSILRRLLAAARGRRPLAADDRATEEDLYYAYRLILKRDPDPAGLEAHRRLVAEGLSLHQLIHSFFNSEEFRFAEDDRSRPTAVDLGGYQVCIQKLDTDFAQAIFHSHQYEEHVRRAAREH